MSTKIEISVIKGAMSQCGVAEDKIRSVMNTLLAEAEAQEGDKESLPAVKKQFVILVSDPENRFPKHDFAGWVLQLPETESPATVQDRIYRAAYDFNASKRGRLLPVKTVGETLENVPSKITKELELWVKTKTPVLVLTCNNDIPKIAAK